MNIHLKNITVSILCFLFTYTTILPSAVAQSIPDNDMTNVDYRDLTSNRVRRPSAIAMGTDILIARPLLLGVTIIGTGLFIVSLPLSILGNNVSEAGQRLVATPAKATFFRCLGCGMSEDRA